MNRRTSLCILLILPIFLLGVKVDAQSMTERENTVCQLRQERFQKFLQTFTEKQTALDEREASVLSSAGVRRQEIDEVISSTRQDFNTQYEKWVIGYKEKSSDASNHAAADTFYMTLKQLVTVRHDSLDKARVAYRTQVDQIREQRYAEINKDIFLFRADAETVFDQLRSSCSNTRRNNGEVRKSFVGSLQEIRLQYAESRRSKQSYKDQIQAAIVAREQAFIEARKTFEQGLQQALSEFRKVDPGL